MTGDRRGTPYYCLDFETKYDENKPVANWQVDCQIEEKRRWGIVEPDLC